LRLTVPFFFFPRFFRMDPLPFSSFPRATLEQSSSFSRRHRRFFFSSLLLPFIRTTERPPFFFSHHVDKRQSDSPGASLSSPPSDPPPFPLLFPPNAERSAWFLFQRTWRAKERGRPPFHLLFFSFFPDFLSRAHLPLFLFVSNDHVPFQRERKGERPLFSFFFPPPPTLFIRPFILDFLPSFSSPRVALSGQL